VQSSVHRRGGGEYVGPAQYGRDPHKNKTSLKLCILLPHLGKARHNVVGICRVPIIVPRMCVFLCAIGIPLTVILGIMGLHRQFTPLHKVLTKLLFFCLVPCLASPLEPLGLVF